MAAQLINPSHFIRPSERAPVEIDENGQRLRTNTVQINAELLYSRVEEVSRSAFRVYLFLLSELKDSSQPIIVHWSYIKLHVLLPRHRQQYLKYKNELIAAGLIFSPAPHIYYINPVFAWKGDTSKLFDPRYIPTVETAPPIPQDETHAQTSEPLTTNPDHE